MTGNLKGIEVECVKRLAERFERGETHLRIFGKWEQLGLTNENFIPVLTMMVSLGVIQEDNKHAGQPFRSFAITAKSAILARQIEEHAKKQAERKDIVEIVKLTLRKHPVTAWSFLVFLAIGGLLAFVNQVLTFLKNIKAID